MVSPVIKSYFGSYYTLRIYSTGRHLDDSKMHPCQTGRLRAWFMQVIYRKKYSKQLTHSCMAKLTHSPSTASLPITHLFCFTFPLLVSLFLLHSSCLFNEERQYPSSPNSRIGWISYLLHLAPNEPSQKGTSQKAGDQKPNPPKALPNLGRHQKEMKLNTSSSPDPCIASSASGLNPVAFVLINARGRMLAGLAPTK